MTLLVKGRRVRRETEARERTRPITITLNPFTLCIGLKGTREIHVLDYETVLALGRKLDARALLRERLEKKAG